jgi:CMP-N-acetylneuraminic acid synthetase
MNENKKIVALIPARSGSKGLINKNIQLYKGIPLLAHSIKVALLSKYISEVFVSTDSEEYAEIAKVYGAQIIIRPKEISDDLSSDLDTFKHFIDVLNKSDQFNKKIDYIVHLRPTYPNRTELLLNNCIEYFINNGNEYDSLRTVVLIQKTPYKMYYIENGILIPFIKKYKDLVEPYNQARQYFPDTYLHNGCIDIVKTDMIIDKNILSGTNILPYIMDETETNDIDNKEDFMKSENKT